MRRPFLSLHLLRATIGALILAVTAAALAGPIGYSNRAVGIRAGVLISDANVLNGVPNNSDPYVWYNLDRNKLVKPAGWYFYNPHAATQVTVPIENRWEVLSGLPLNSGLVNLLGTQMTKANAPYWEVNLSSINDNSINDYDVLILPVYGVLSLNPAERARLSRFVDQGGVLWIDVNNQTTIDAANGPPLAFNISLAGANVASVLSTSSQVLNHPYAITAIPEATWATSLVPVDVVAAGYPTLLPILNPIFNEFGQYEIDAEAGSGGQPTILTSHQGNGAIVVTARGEANFLNDGTRNGIPIVNQGFTAIDADPNANANQIARFAVNAINLVNGSSQDGAGSRKSSGTPVDITSPLIGVWKDESGAGPGGTVPGLLPTSGAPPVTYKGLFIVSGQDSAGQWRLFAYNAVPGSDIDQNGTPDDGIQDLSQGFNRDLIWRSAPLNGPLSSPVALESPGQSLGVTDIVGVVDGKGNVDCFNAFPLTSGSFTVTAGGEPTLITFAPPNGQPTLAAGQIPFAPTVHEGLIYVTDNIDNNLNTVGRVWVADPTNPPAGTKDQPWAVGGPPSNALSQVSGPVTIGYIPIADNSGGVDGVGYVATAASGGGPGGQSCGISSIWINTKGEKHPVQLNDKGGGVFTLALATRASVQNRPVYDPQNHNISDPHGLHIALETANGDVLTVNQMSKLLTGVYVTGGGEDGTYEFTLVNGVNQASFDNAGVVAVSIDYWIDWDFNNLVKGVTLAPNVVRGSIQLPDDSDRAKNIIGNLALSPAGTLYAVEGNPTDAVPNGMFYAIREQGQGSFNVVTRFDLYSAFTLSTPGITAVSSNIAVSATFEDNDPTQNFSAFIGGQKFSNLTFQSGPSVANGRVFVKARGTKNGAGVPVPCMLLLCFNAEPALPSFTVPVLQDNFTILQPDYNSTDPADKTQPTAFTQMSGNSGQLVYTAGTDHGTISLTSLASTQRGLLSQTLNESLPIIIRQPGVPDLYIDPSTVGSWNPLEWYTVFYGIDPAGSGGFNPMNATGSPVVTGNTVFVAGNSYFPAILQGVFNPLTSTPTGMLVGYNGALSAASDSFSIPNQARPYFKQIAQTTGPASSPFAANSDLEWPQVAASGNANAAVGWNIYQQRLYQTVLDGANLALSPFCFGLTAGDGTLFAYSNLGVYGFKRANFTVADEGRLAVFDPAGNALWTSDQSLSYGLAVASTAGQSYPAASHPLVRPTRAYPIGSSDFLVVDPGSNRLARIDVSGREIRSIEGFGLDPNFQPTGYVNGEPLTFNQPQDVLSFVNYVAAANNPFSAPQASEYWRHYVVADTGNHRLVELVDRYSIDPNTNQPSGTISLGNLFYHSPANLSGKRGYDYNSVARIQVPGIPQNQPQQFLYATSLGTTEPTLNGLGLDTVKQDQIPTGGTAPFQAKDARDGNGGIIVLTNTGPIVINQVVVPQIAAGVLYDPKTGTFNSAPIPAHYKKLGNLSSVSMAYVNNGQAPVLTIMFTDSTGVYEINLAPNPIGGKTPPQDWVIDWMMPTEVYTQLRRDPGTGLPNQNAFLNASELRATYARRTSAGTVLLVNGYFGTDQDAAGTSFPGEIIELNGDFLGPNFTRGFSLSSPFLGFDSLSVTFQLPAVQGARGIIAPIFADRR